MTDHARNLRRHVVDVCRDFELLQAFAAGEFVVVGRGGLISATALQCVMLPLAQAVLFNAVRAMRILEHAPAHIEVDRTLRKSMLSALRRLRDVRDLNEHWTDPGHRKAGPSPALHASVGIWIDEVSLAVHGPESILVGPINLFDIYQEFVSFLGAIMEADGHGAWVRMFP